MPLSVGFDSTGIPFRTAEEIDNILAALQTAFNGLQAALKTSDGMWTPVIGGGDGTTGQTYAVQIGTYLKIGSLVIAGFDCTLTAKGTITGGLQIRGLPFKASSAITARWIGTVVWHDTVTNFVNMQWQLNSGQTSISILGTTAAGTSSATGLTTADIGDTTIFRGTVIYKTDS